MAIFKWVGEIARPTLVQTLGPVLLIRMHCCDGVYVEVEPDDAVNGFQINEEISVTDDRCLRAFRCDPRFSEVL